MDPATTKTIHKTTSARRAIKKTADIFFTVLLLLAVIVAVYIFQNKKTNGQVQIGGYQLLIVLSGSMSPSFDTGSVVLVQRTAPEDIVVGDIITFIGATDTGKTITHRVIAIDTQNGLQFTTKGDANNVADSIKQDPENIIGKVRYSIPYIGYFLEFSKTKTGIYLLIVLPSLIILMLEIRKIIGYLMVRKKGKKTKGMEIQEPAKTDDRRIDMIQEELQKSVLPTDIGKILSIERERKIIIPVEPKPIVASMDKPQKTQVSASNASMDLLYEVQNQSTQEIYHYRIQEETIRKKLQDKLELKLQEEEELDRSIQRIREELLRKLKSNNE